MRALRESETRWVGDLDETDPRPAVENISRAQCGIPETNHDASVIAQTLVHFFLQTIFFGLRMLCRAVRIAPWGWDDTTIVIAYVSATRVVHGPAALLDNPH